MLEQKEDSNGYIVFVDKSRDKSTLVKEDPVFKENMAQIIEKYSIIRYTAYRSAIKMFTLKKMLSTVNIPFDMITSVLERHKLNSVDTTPSVTPFQLTSVIHDIFFGGEKLGYFSEQTNFNIQQAVSLVANFIWSVFDRNRNTPISALEVKLTLLTLSDTSSMEQLIFEHFLITADHNRCVSRIRFAEMLRVLSKILTYLDEGVNYGQHCIESIVQESFETTPGIAGLNEYQFTCLWKMKTLKVFTNFSNLLGLTKRIKDCQFILHNSSCVGCQISPIQGLRFKCQRCRKFSLCLNCFSNGFSNSNHELSHRMYEISSDEIIPNKFATILSKLCTIFTKNSNTLEKLNMEVKLIDEKGEEIFENETTNFDQSESLPISRSNNQSGLNKLKSVIDQLSVQHQLFVQQKNELDMEFIENHEKCILNQIEKLQELWLQQTISVPHSSTPYGKNNSSKREIQIASPLSKTIHGTDINRTYLEQNKSDLSIGDVSSWFQMRRTILEKRELSNCADFKNPKETEMNNFKILLHKVKEIVDDSYSDNDDLCKATHQLEKVLDDIIGGEELKRLK